MTEQNKLPQGILISGICKGVKVESYNGLDNHYAGFDVQFLDDYGQTQTRLEEVAVFGQNAQAIIDKANSSIGKHCVISVNKRALKSDRTGNAYMRTTINRSSQIFVIS